MPRGVKLYISLGTALAVIALQSKWQGALVKAVAAFRYYSGLSDEEDKTMLRSIDDLHGMTIHATDGDIGTVDQFLFDDEAWTVRYLVVDTGGWLTGRLVLISPIAIGGIDWEGQKLDVALTREQVERSPDIATDEPVSRQKEREYFRYYGYPLYWGGAGLWGAGMYPGVLGYPTTVPYVPPATAAAAQETIPPAEEEHGDPHLRSTQEVAGYSIQATDDEIGHVEDFIIDDETWAIRYMVVDTRNWWPGKKVLVAPQWITEVSWAESKVYVDLPRETIKNGPEYDPSTLINREYEARLYDYYGRPAYWDETP
jgi:uncharacterized protein YrrD